MKNRTTCRPPLTGQREANTRFFRQAVMAGCACTLSLNVWASECYSSVASTSVDLKTISVSPDLAVGQSITGGDKTFDSVQFASCESSFTVEKYFYGYLYSSLASAGTYNGRLTFKTNLSGVGVQLGASMSDTKGASGNGWITSGSSIKLLTDDSIGWGAMIYMSITPKLNLIKIADSVSGGTLSGKVGYGQANGNQGSANININFTGTLSASGCTLSGGSDLSFTLDDVQKSELPSVGSTWGESSEKDISLSCTAGTNVYFTLSGTQEPGTSDTSILKNNGTAKGLSVQVMDLHGGGNHPVNLNYRWSPITSSGTTAKIPLAARYIRTGDLTPGSVDASATYTLDYD